MKNVEERDFVMDKRIYIVGAHSRAQTLTEYLRCLYPEMKVEAYLYDNEEKNPVNIKGTPVLRLVEGLKLNTTYPVYIGTRGIYHARLVQKLKKTGFEEIYPVTVELDLKLRNTYLKRFFSDKERRFLKIETLEMCPKFDIKENPGSFNSHYKREFSEECKSYDNMRNGTQKKTKAAVYVAKSVFDKPLEEEYRLAPYEKEIQVGAALTDVRLHPKMATDNTGENISEKNKQYCELTAMYWIWKHAAEEIVGLVHYRRHFILPDNWVRLMEDNEVDVILPTPLYVSPSVAENYRKRHIPLVWESMMEYLKKEDIRTYEEAKNFFSGNLYCPCNMFIMKKDVLNGFCEWLFSVLDAVVMQNGQKSDGYQNRYPGFLSERLLTFYFEKNRDRFKSVYADKNFLV